MTLENFLFTSESVTEGHPDKLADQISDSVLDAIYKKDPNGRVACETLVSTGLVVVAGEITTTCYVDIPKIVRQTIRDVGYTRAKFGFDYETCAVITAIDEQSPDISQGVTAGQGLFEELGAGDQGSMFGYATNETEELMPMPIMLAHKLAMRLAEVRKDGTLAYLRPDGKSQVTIEYREGKPHRLDAVVIAAQHSPDVEQEQLTRDIKEHVIKAVVPPHFLDDNDVKYFINPTGRFVEGGPKADCGLTGRKIIVDTYGGMGHHGGGCFSGKDPTKVDRSGAYAARHIAKNIVAAGLADKCEVQLAYAIGVPEPVSVTVDTFGTGKVDQKTFQQLIRTYFPLKVGEIINRLNLRRPIFKKTSVYGHFGKDDPDFTWERADKADLLRKAVNL